MHCPTNYFPDWEVASIDEKSGFSILVLSNTAKASSLEVTSLNIKINFITSDYQEKTNFNFPIKSGRVQSNSVF
ncbi:hypothetical protein PanWU01x14_070820 [Parasponia andersonii]|uniref:Uncharacterized protein n=1 Tax=Parasponia andersonii TaxID=3476 RepID=A0A2P5DF15_PARAD|nr:hypothetical protein PanWU01x14_070820 [Parasponia andersonii]